jgi:hypothetical protein
VLSDKVRRRIARERGKGLSLGAIAAKLNDQGVPTATKGGQWYASTVSHVLRSVALDEELEKVASGHTRSSA